MTIARTIGMTTAGSWTATARPTPSRASTASSRQLHWARRSSQPGTSDPPSLAGAITSISEPVTAMIRATTGMTANSPTIPQSAAPAGSAIRTIAGWMWTVLP